jgi:hypothetical protein
LGKFGEGTSMMKRVFIPLFALWLALVLSCNQTMISNKPLQIPYSRGSDTSVLSPNESIDSFVITAADNPGFLVADVRGTIFFDTIKLFFNPGTDISSLTPTIGITGMSITPASKTPENFDSSVHYVLMADNGAILNYWVVSYFR